jgi:hypothetical protein
MTDESKIGKETQDQDAEDSSGSAGTSRKIPRRDFLTGTALAAAGLTIVPRHVLGGPGHTAPSDRLNIAGIGVGGMGKQNIRALASENIVALCDVDWGYTDKGFREMFDIGKAQARLAQAETAEERLEMQERIEQAKLLAPKYASIKRYTDYRRMLEQQKDIDAVVIATPDHLHAVIASAAMSLGKHVYLQKPLTWSIHEARHLARKAKDNPKLVTQMGNQGHSTDEARLINEYIAAGAIGHVSEVHVAGDSAPGDEAEAGRREVEPGSGDGPAGQRDGRKLSEAGRAGMGSVPRPRPGGRLPPGVSPVQLARVGGLGRGRHRRHGRAPDRSSVLGAGPGLPDVGGDRLHAVQPGLVPDGDDDALRVPCARQHAAGEAQLVRRRPEAARTGNARRR